MMISSFTLANYAVVKLFVYFNVTVMRGALSVCPLNVVLFTTVFLLVHRLADQRFRSNKLFLLPIPHAESARKTRSTDGTTPEKKNVGLVYHPYLEADEPFLPGVESRKVDLA